MKLANCRSCGASIIWGQLNGRPHPFDARTTIDGTWDLGDGRKSHFATTWRRR